MKTFNVKPHSVLLSVIVSLVLVGCQSMAVHGTGRSFAVTHELAPITEIELHGKGQLHLHNSASNELVVSAQQEIHDYLTIERRGDRLIIKPKEGYYFKTQENIQFDLYVNNIERIDVSGSLTLIASQYETPTLVIDASGSTDVDMTIQTDRLTIDTSGSLDGYLAGQTDRLILDFSGSADLNAYDLDATEVDIDVSGASNLYVRVADRLNISATGAAKIYYKGTPAVSQSSAGAVTIAHAND